MLRISGQPSRTGAGEPGRICHGQLTSEIWSSVLMPPVKTLVDKQLLRGELSECGEARDCYKKKT